MMRTTTSLARSLALAAAGTLGASVTVAAASPPLTGPAAARLAGSAASVTGRGPGLSPVDGAPSRTVEVWLAGRGLAAQRFAGAVSTPGSASYQRYLSPRTYTRRFGPRPGQVQAVETFLTSAGFSRVRASGQDDYVSGIAPVSGVERAFAVLRRSAMTGPESRSRPPEINDRDLSVPAAIRGDILTVTGLDHAPSQAADSATGVMSRRVSGRLAVCSRYWGQHTKTLSPAFDGLTRAGVAVCGYSADQIRRAYGLGSLHSAHTPTGTGRTIALVQGDGAPFDMFRALTDYAKANGLPRPRRDQYRQEAAGGSSTRPCDNESTPEASLDSEAAYATAPGADQLMVDGNGCLGGEDGDQGLLDAELAPLVWHGSRPQAAIESVSYGDDQSERRVLTSDRAAQHAIALRAAAEGVSLLFSSGDYKGVHLPASDPDVTAVGGTTLGIGAHGQRLFETGWSDGLVRRKDSSGPWRSVGVAFGSGGGISAIYGQPIYQRGVVPRPMASNRAGELMRAVPDIAADADPETGMLTGQIAPLPHGKSTGYETSTSFGTSQSTPLVAGMIADAEQGRRARLGFLNPLLYSLAGTHAFNDVLPETPADPQIDRVSYSARGLGGRGTIPAFLDLFDNENPRFTSQVTATGYDTMTGLGSPNGAAFIKALRSG